MHKWLSRAIGPWLLASLLALPALAQDNAPLLPKVVLLGDSIRLSYTPYVEKALAGQAVVVSPKANGGDSSRVLQNLDEWAIREQPAVVHFNCGIHDTKRSKSTGQFQVSPDDYAANLRKIVERLRRETKAVIIFALTTPVDDARAAKGRQKVDYELLETSAAKYNEIALAVMRELDVPVNDLRTALGAPAEQQRLLGGDGIHFTAAGYEKLGSAVANEIRRQLPKQPALPQPEKCDILVYGGTAGGVIAAVQAARMGKQVILIEPGKHLGGMTSGGLGATDFKNPDAVGGLAREFYQRVKRYYSRPSAWKYERPEDYRSVRHDPAADVMWHFEPHVAERILESLAHESGVRVVYGQRLDLKAGVKKDGPRIVSIGMESGHEFIGQVFIDATYEGDLMARRASRMRSAARRIPSMARRSTACRLAASRTAATISFAPSVLTSSPATRRAACCSACRRNRLAKKAKATSACKPTAFAFARRKCPKTVLHS